MSNVVSFPSAEVPNHLKNPPVYIRGSASMTPDFKELKHCGEDFFLVFVWDDCKADHLYHGYVEDGAYYGRAHTNLMNFCMKIEEKSQSPIVFQANNYRLSNTVLPMFDMGKIQGEVYALPLRALCDLDLVMYNTCATQREEVWVALEDDKVNRSIKVWMYIGKEDYYDKGKNEILKMRNCSSKGYGQYGKTYYYSAPNVPDKQNIRINEYMGIDENIYI